SPNAQFIQGDVQFPPVAFEHFDIVHCSGVLIHTNNTELSFSCIEPCVKKGGKLSVWLYHPRKNFIHNLFNFIRRFTSRLPARIQYILYAVTLFPVTFIVKRLKGNKIEIHFHKRHLPGDQKKRNKAGLSQYYFEQFYYLCPACPAAPENQGSTDDP